MRKKIFAPLLADSGSILATINESEAHLAEATLENSSWHQKKKRSHIFPSRFWRGSTEA